MGEKQNQPFQLLFNASLKVDFPTAVMTTVERVEESDQCP